MRRAILNIVFLLLAAASLFAQDAHIDEWMRAGNEAYRADKYSEALTDYLKIENEGYAGVGLYYNLGNTYYRLGQLGKAILYYERALLLDPNNEDVIYNLQIAKAHTKDKIKEVPKIFLAQWWDTLISYFSPKGWAFFLVIFFLVFLALLAVWFFTKNVAVRQSAFFIGIVDIIIVALLTVFLFTSLKRESSNRHGVLLAEEVTAKLSPDEKSGDAFIIHEGLKFKIEDELRDWAEIKLPDGKVGWLPKEAFEEI
ncbi:MAG: tetratricopeptide repeat protein [Chlorobi bacterium]|nr:tetratricopeptide repeat protein [Chlorobiota bacterium]